MHKYPFSDSPLGPARPRLPPMWSSNFSPLYCVQCVRVLPCIAASSSLMSFLLVSLSVVCCGDMVCLSVLLASSISLSLSPPPPVSRALTLIYLGIAPNNLIIKIKLQQTTTAIEHIQRKCQWKRLCTEEDNFLLVFATFQGYTCVNFM